MRIARTRIAVVVCSALVASGIALGGGVAAAADKNCKDFSSQAAAQTYFVANGGSATNNVDDLDRDHDGRACQDYPYTSTGGASSSTTSASTPASTTAASASNTTSAGAVNCRNFATQGDAQAYLERDRSDPAGLDADHNGVACEDYFGDADTGVSAGSTQDDGSTAVTSGSQVRAVPEGSADTGSW